MPSGPPNRSRPAPCHCEYDTAQSLCESVVAAKAVTPRGLASAARPAGPAEALPCRPPRRHSCTGFAWYSGFVLLCALASASASFLLSRRVVARQSQGHTALHPLLLSSLCCPWLTTGGPLALVNHGLCGIVCRWIYPLRRIGLDYPLPFDHPDDIAASPHSINRICADCVAIADAIFAPKAELHELETITLTTKIEAPRALAPARSTICNGFPACWRRARRIASCSAAQGQTTPSRSKARRFHCSNGRCSPESRTHLK
jgi:hypothetical protein